jgi:Na+(H+)/acetate symporter ActP
VTTTNINISALLLRRKVSVFSFLPLLLSSVFYKKKNAQVKVICIKLKLICIILYEFVTCSFTLMGGRIWRVLENRAEENIGT